MMTTMTSHRSRTTPRSGSSSSHNYRRSPINNNRISPNSKTTLSIVLITMFGIVLMIVQYLGLQRYQNFVILQNELQQQVQVQQQVQTSSVTTSSTININPSQQQPLPTSIMEEEDTASSTLTVATTTTTTTSNIPRTDKKKQRNNNNNNNNNRSSRDQFSSVWSWATTVCPEQQEQEQEQPILKEEEETTTTTTTTTTSFKDYFFPSTLPSKTNTTTTNTSLSLSTITTTPFCPPTKQIRIRAKCPYWELTTYDEYGIEKMIGGDEYYITYTDDYSIYTTPNYETFTKGYQLAEDYEQHQHQQQSKQQQSKHPTAIAEIKDYSNGTYQLNFITSPLNERLHRLKGTNGILTVTLQYTCFIGTLHPPTKNNWSTGGYSVVQYPPQVITVLPPLTQFQPPIIPRTSPIRTSSRTTTTTNTNNNNNNNDNIIDLSKYTIIPIGDSLLQHFVASRNMKLPNIGSPLTTSTIEKFHNLIGKHHYKLQQLQQLSSSTSTTSPRRGGRPRPPALLLTSSTWDLLSTTMQEHTNKTMTNNTLSTTTPILSTTTTNYWKDHIDAMKLLIEKIQITYPNITIFWKSPTALHIHVPVLQLQHGATKKLRRQFGKQFTNRLRYMSSSRSYELYQQQKQEQLIHNFFHYSNSYSNSSSSSQKLQSQQQLQQQLQNPNSSSITSSSSVIFLDIYQASYLSADHTCIGDGRHYQPNVNTMMVNWFYQSYHIEYLWNYHYLTIHSNKALLEETTTENNRIIKQNDDKTNNNTKDADDNNVVVNNNNTAATTAITTTVTSDRAFLVAYYSCPAIHPTKNEFMSDNINSSSNNDTIMYYDNVVVNIVNSFVVAMVLNRTLLLKYQLPPSLLGGNGEVETTHNATSSSSTTRILSEVECNQQLWDHPHPPSWIPLYDDWVSKFGLDTSPLPIPPTIHAKLTNRERLLAPVQSTTPMGVSQLTKAGYYTTSRMVIDELFQDGEDIFLGMLTHDVFPPFPPRKSEGTGAQGRHQPFAAQTIKSSEGLVIGLSPNSFPAPRMVASMNGLQRGPANEADKHIIDLIHQRHDTKIGQCLDRLLGGTGLHGRMECFILVPSQNHYDRLWGPGWWGDRWNHTLPNLLRRTNCSFLEHPRQVPLLTNGTVDGYPSFTTEVAFHHHVAETVYDGLIYGNCQSGSYRLLKHLVHYLRAQNARQHGQFPVLPLPDCCLDDESEST